MKTKDILERIGQMEDDLTEIHEVADANQIAKIIETLEKYNKHSIIISYMKWNLGVVIALTSIGLIGLILAISVYMKL